MFSSKFTLHGDFFSSATRNTLPKRITDHQSQITNKKAPTIIVGALESASTDLLRVEDAEAAARNHWEDVATAKAYIRVARKHRISKNARCEIIGINRSGRKIIGANRIVRRERRGDHLINPNTSSREGFVQPFMKPSCLRVFRSFKKRALLQGSAKISEPDDFVGVAQTAAKFLFDIGAAGGQRASNHRCSKERQCVTHNSVLSVDWTLARVTGVCKVVIGRKIRNPKFEARKKLEIRMVNGEPLFEFCLSSLLALFVLAFPVPGYPDADFVEDK